MKVEIVNQILKHYPFLSESALIAEIVKVGKVLHYRKGETLLNFGHYIKMVPLLIDGSIKVLIEGEDGSELLLYYLSVGETCSMSFSFCLTSQSSRIKTIAEQDTTLIGIPLEYVNKWMEEYKSWSKFVMRAYDMRLREMVQTLDNIVFNQLDERLLKCLQQKSLANQSRFIYGTHQQIADELNVSRESVSRLLKKLEKKRYIALNRNEIQLFDTIFL